MREGGGEGRERRRDGGREGEREGKREGGMEGKMEGERDGKYERKKGRVFLRDHRGPSNEHGEGLLNSPTAVKWLSKVNHGVEMLVLVLTACSVLAGRT